MMNVNLKAYKILLIEDYSTMRMSIKEMLYLGSAQQIIEAVNAKAAIAAMEKQKFDIILCDYNLGLGQNGQQFLEEVKHRKLLPYTAIFIMVTAEQASSMVLSAVDNKPDEYLAKPFNAQQLFSRIEKQLQRKAHLTDIAAAVDKDELPLAIAHCKKLLNEQNPKMRTQLLKIGAELAINVGDFKTAQQYYQEVLGQRDLAWAKLGLGVIAYLQNDFDAAILIFIEVINQAPMMIETYDWLTKAYEKLDKNQDALFILMQAVELSPQALIRQQKLAALAIKVGDLDVAQKAYKSAITLGHHSVHTSCQDYSGLAKMYAKANNFKEAFILIKEMREKFQKNPEAALRAAQLETDFYLADKNPAAALDAYEKMQLIKQQSIDIPNDLLLDIAETHFLMANVEASNQLLGELIGNYVDDERFIKELIARHKLFSKDELYAEELFKRTKQALIEMNNEGVNLFKQGQINAAVALLEDAYHKTPRNKFILMNLTKILLREMKSSGISNDKISKINAYITKAAAIGIAQDKIGNLKMELTKLSAPTPSYKI